MRQKRDTQSFASVCKALQCPPMTHSHEELSSNY
nr:MAG TPA: hypothetical protein [Caudoviricetes sp.]